MTHSHTSTQDVHDMARVVAVISYLTLVGWFIAIVLHSNYRTSFSTFHLRQALGLIITAAILTFIPLIGWLLNIVLAIFWLISFVHAIRGDFYLVPKLGTLFQHHFTFIR